MTSAAGLLRAPACGFMWLLMWAFEWFVNYCEHCVCGVWRAPQRWVAARRYIEHELLLSSYRTGRRSAWLLGADHRAAP